VNEIALTNELEVLSPDYDPLKAIQHR